MAGAAARGNARPPTATARRSHALAACAAVARDRAASASARWRSSFARGAAVRNAARRMASPAASCASCRYVAAGQHPDLRVVEPVEFDDERCDTSRVEWIAVDRIRALIDWAQLTSHRRVAKVAVIAPAERMNAAGGQRAAEDARGAAARRRYLILVSAASPARLPATVRSRCRKHRRARPASSRRARVASAQGVDRPRLVAARRRRAARRCSRSRSPTPAIRRERAVWLTALAAPRPVRVSAWPARIDAAPARGAQASGFATLSTGCSAGAAISRACTAGGAPRRRIADRAAALALASRRRWRRSRCFAIIERCCASAALVAHPFSRASSPRRC